MFGHPTEEAVEAGAQQGNIAVERGWYNAQSSSTQGPTKAFQGSRLSAAEKPPKSNPNPTTKREGVDDFKTLKQACSSEYQGAQGAFKDSMIH